MSRLRHRALHDRVGTTVAEGKYTITRRLGTGAMGTVYAATHRNGNRVAIKFLNEALSDPETVSLFTREAYVANSVGHPDAVEIRDDGVDESGVPFLLMELLEGESVEARLVRNSRRLPLDEVVVMMLQVLAVLESAHAKNIVHRDIKPANLFVTTDGRTRVLDFGIARDLVSQATLTKEGAPMGTVEFMPPEQARGDRGAVGPHTDCWSVGASIFKLLSGEFVHGEQTVEAARQRARSITSVMPELHRDVATCIDKALAFDPARRWPSAKEMRIALHAAAETALGEEIALAADRVRARWVGDLREHAKRSRLPANTPPGWQRFARGSTPPTGESLQSRRRQYGVIGLFLLALTGALAVAILQMQRPRVASRPSNAPIISNRPEARVAFDAGRQLWMDASTAAARKKFAESAQLDPEQPVGYLYSAASTEIFDPAARQGIAQAQALRARLSPEQQNLLFALEPLVREPPEYDVVTARLGELTSQSSADSLLWAVRAAHDLRRRDPRQLLVDADHVPPALASWFRARAALIEGDIGSARTALAACLDASAFALDCLAYSARLETNEGACDAAALAAERYIHAAPEAPDGYGYLARAEFGRNHSTDDIRAILAEKWKHTAEEKQAYERARDMTFLSVEDGNFDLALANLDDWERATSQSQDALTRLYPFIARAKILLELGRAQDARRVALALSAESRAWVRNERIDPAIEVARMLYLTQQISRTEFLERRAREEEATQAQGGYRTAAIRWYDAYVQTVVTAEDALIAIAHRPAEAEVADAAIRDAAADSEVGRMYLLANDLEHATPPLRRAARSCSYWQAIEGVRAHALYADAVAQSDVREACSGYEYVVQRWGRDPRSRTARAAHEGARHLACADRGPH